ncbi:hypothetical protein EJB05_29178, partial [Eragrostis curvula]
METEAYPRWVLLARYGEEEDEHEYPGVTGDDKTVAACFTYAGHPIRFSLRIAAPPATSCLWVHSPEGRIWSDPCVIASHGNALLVQIETRVRRSRSDFTVLHFVYSAVDRRSSRPPSLRLLPHCNFIVQNIRRSFCTEDAPAPRGFFIEKLSDHHATPRLLDRNATGILRRGKDAFVVAELQMAPSEYRKPAAELLLLRSGRWSVKRALITHGGDKCRELSSWRTDSVVSVGDRFLCWIDLSRGVMFADVLDDSPVLRYVSFPLKHRCYTEPKRSQNVCATAAGMVKLVEICTSHRCGCWGTRCPHSCYPCTVESWTLRMDDMGWVMDRVELECPVVSVDDPNVICFLVCESEQHYEKQWMVMVDMRSKTVQSVCRCPNVGRRYYDFREKEPAIPTKLSSYFV